MLRRLPYDIISYVVWLCFRLNLIHRDVEDLLAILRIKFILFL